VHAERYALAVTLYEMATGKLPRFGDGQSDPALLDGEAALDTEFFDPDLRESMVEFFEKALRRVVLQKQFCRRNRTYRQSRRSTIQLSIRKFPG